MQYQPLNGFHSTFRGVTDQSQVAGCIQSKCHADEKIYNSIQCTLLQIKIKNSVLGAIFSLLVDAISTVKWIPQHAPRRYRSITSQQVAFKANAMQKEKKIIASNTRIYK